MRQYLDLLQDVLDNGTWKEQRAVRPDGSPLRTIAVFGRQIRFNLREGFPLVTTKRMSIRNIAAELVWFLSGSTNNNDLQALGCNIWEAWAMPDGELGPVYGKQWRRWEGPQGTVDQVARLVEGVREVVRNPGASVGRRLILTAWNPADMPRARPDGSPALPPIGCHTLSQYDVTEGRLSCHLYQRSADMFLGVPYNIASYALLTHLLARATGLEVGEYIHTFGDAHIYENHLEQVREQVSRPPHPLPTLDMDATVTGLEGLAPDMFRVVGYTHHPPLRGEVAI